MFSGLPCKTHIAHIAHIARNPGRVDVRRVGAPYAPHFAWFLHGFGERVASGVGFHPENPITGPAPKVRQRRCPRSIADISPLTRPAVNPAVATGLLHPILLWQQDCSTQSCCGNRIAPPNPAVATGLPRCFPENAGSAVLYSTTPPDSPPGLRGKHRQCVGTHRCTPGLAARIARKTTEAHCCIAGHSRKKPAAMP